MGEDLTALFYDLVKIPSPSGSELGVANFIMKDLAKKGIKVVFDNTGKYNDSDSGNLFAKVDGKGPTIMFIAHMDTVEDGSMPIKPMLKNGVITSEGTAILGVDNKASVAALMSALPEIMASKKHANVVAMFSSREENGVMGVTVMKLKKKPDYAFSIDGSGEVGTFITAALGYAYFWIEIKGKEAHAANNPEQGRNSIKAASMIIAKQKLGKYPDGSTMNVGKIEGGTFANVVPGKTTVLGEVRGTSKASMEKRFAELEKNIKAACKATGCTYKLVRSKSDTPPFNMKGNEKIIALAKKSAKAAGLKFGAKKLSATIEANRVSAKGISVMGMVSGGKSPHSSKESIKVKELYDLKKLIIALAQSA